MARCADLHTELMWDQYRVGWQGDGEAAASVAEAGLHQHAHKAAPRASNRQ